jgi:hypothetical protein
MKMTRRDEITVYETGHMEQDTRRKTPPLMDRSYCVLSSLGR